MMEQMANLRKNGMPELPKLSDDDHKEIRQKTKENVQKNFPDMTEAEIDELQDSSETTPRQSAREDF